MDHGDLFTTIGWGNDNRRSLGVIGGGIWGHTHGGHTDMWGSNNVGHSFLIRI